MFHVTLPPKRLRRTVYRAAMCLITTHHDMQGLNKARVCPFIQIKYDDPLTLNSTRAINHHLISQLKQFNPKTYIIIQINDKRATIILKKIK